MKNNVIDIWLEMKTADGTFIKDACRALSEATGYRVTNARLNDWRWDKSRNIPFKVMRHMMIEIFPAVIQEARPRARPLESEKIEWIIDRLMPPVKEKADA